MHGVGIRANERSPARTADVFVNAGDLAAADSLRVEDVALVHSREHFVEGPATVGLIRINPCTHGDDMRVRRRLEPGPGSPVC